MPRQRIEITDEGSYLLYHPIGTPGGVVVFCHGGFGNTTEKMPDCRMLARNGYLTAAPKYGKPISLEEDINKVVDTAQDFVPKEICFMGSSRGAYLLAKAINWQINLGGKDSVIFCAGPFYTDRWPQISQIPPQYHPYFSEPVDHIETDRPILLIYGEKDETVPMEQAIWFKQDHPTARIRPVPYGHMVLQHKATWEYILWWLRRVN
jgi:esterase/lipase